MENLTTTTYVIKGLQREINKQYPELKFAYTTNLAAPFAEIQARSNANSSPNPLNKTSLPLFAFNRSQLRPSALGGRGVRYSAYGSPPDPTNPSVTKYRIAHCEFDINFSIVDKDISTIEGFEIDYLSKEGLGRITEYYVDFSPSEIGIQKYYVTWPAMLNNLQTSSDQNSYRSIDGIATVQGFFISLFGEVPLISQINASLHSQFNLIETITIP